MTTSPSPSDATAARTYSAGQVGLCARCQAKTHRYGPNGNPLCPPCLASARALQGKKAKTAR